MLPVFVKPLIIIFLVLQIVFLGCLSYLYGALYKGDQRVFKFKVLAVNLDDGIIAKSLELAYDQLKGPAFPTLFFEPAETYGSDPDQILQAVVDGHYWAAVYTSANASTNFLNALASNSSAASYNASQVMNYVWDEVRYPAFSDSLFLANFNALTGAVGVALDEIYGSTAVKAVNTADSASVQVLLHPVSQTFINLQPTTQTPRLFFNTVTMAMAILQQFFFVLGINIFFDKMGLYRKLSKRKLTSIRFGTTVLFALIGALCITGYMWAFRENWAVTGKQFVLTWMALWLLILIHAFLLLSISCLLPLPIMPIVLLLWIFMTLASTIVPLELSPGFYHWGYALPGYEAYQVLTDIWSGGRVPALFRALPILFSWLVLVLVFFFFAHSHKWNVAQKAGPPGPHGPEPDAEAALEGSSGASDVAKDTDVAPTASDKI